jgi:hypothetical protein
MGSQAQQPNREHHFHVSTAKFLFTTLNMALWLFEIPYGWRMPNGMA